MTQESSLKYSRGNFYLRIAYAAAIIGFACVCYYFYSQQSLANKNTSEIRAAYNDFVVLDTTMDQFVKTVSEFKDRYRLDADESSLDPSYDLPYAINPFPTDVPFVNVQEHLLREVASVSSPFVDFVSAYENTSTKQTDFLVGIKEEAGNAFTTGELMSSYEQILDTNPILGATTKSDFLSLSSKIEQIYADKIEPQSLAISKAFRDRLNTDALSQEEVLKQFTYLALGFIVFLVLLVFLPLDLYFNKLFSKLVQEDERVAAADASKGQFLENINREIKEPLNGILNLTDMLIKSDLSLEQQTFTDGIVKSTGSALTLIDDIQDLTKINSKEFKLVNAPFNLVEAVEQAGALVASRLFEKDIELIMRIDPALPTHFRGDVGYIRQIIINLLGNAIKYTQEGYVCIDVSGVDCDVDGTDNTASDAHRLLFKIEDSGLGIAPDQLKTIFNKHAQADVYVSNDEHVIEHGLAISSALVELLEGEIGVESTLGHGSTFWFKLELPAFEAIDDHADILIDIAGARVLVVHDNEIALQTLSEKLNAWGLDHAACLNGQEALSIMRTAMCSNVNLDCVILDSQMQMMSGKSIVEEMRKDPLLKNIPVIMLMGVRQIEDEKALRDLNVWARLTKPIMSTQLLEKLSEVIKPQVSDDAAYGPASIAVDPKQIGVQLPETLLAKDHEAFLEEAKSLEDAKPDAKQIDVLICEDNDVNQLVFSQILEGENLSYRIAKNGLEGVQMFKELKPRLMLLDVSMPKMNGFEVAGAIRECENGESHLPIIGVTAHAIKGDMEKCLAAGMDDYVSKPVSPNALIAKVHHWLTSAENENNKLSA